VITRVGERLRRYPVTANGNFQATHLGLHHIAADVDVVTEAGLEQVRDLADRNSRLGHRELDFL
jgi:hypothetical protein